MTTLPPIKLPTEEYEKIEKHIRDLFKKEIYEPIIAEFKGVKKIRLRNSESKYLSEALLTGRVTYNRGVFSGYFNSRVSKELKALGAKWKDGAYHIPASRLTPEIKNTISLSFNQFQLKIDRINAKLTAIVPEEVASKLHIEKIFDAAIYKTDMRVRDSAKLLTIQPSLTKEQREKIAREWQNNMDLWIKDFTEKEIVELRKKMQKSVLAGNRYESAIGAIKKSYGVSAKKAQFLARQETMLLTTKLKEVRYIDAGVTKYKWKSVKGTPAHPVRPMHKQLNDRSEKGEVFDFRHPPVDDPNGSRHNPSQNYNCFPSDTLITLYHPINKAFRRRYSGELTKLILDNGIVLESTRNHPILTQQGWVPAHLLNISDYVFESVFEDRFGEEMDGEYIKSGIEQIFNALSLCVPVRRDGGTESDFHGDGIKDEKIDIISTDRELMLEGVLHSFQKISEFIFELSNSSDSGIRSINEFCHRWGIASSDLISLQGELGAFFSIHSTHAQNIRFRTIPFSDSTNSNPTSDNIPRHEVFLRDGKFTHPALIILDRIFINLHRVPSNGSADTFDFNSLSPEALTDKIWINFNSPTDFSNSKIRRFVKPARLIDKSFRNFSGHIYNLETNNHWYTANNTIVANCRCVALPVIEFVKEKE